MQRHVCAHAWDDGADAVRSDQRWRKLLDSLRQVGVKASDVTDILITHIHTDHTGGLVEGGKPVFANAVVHVGEPDLVFSQSCKRP
ncbi:MBL fold metallo-hydrolase (plasmid) [Aliirhizobium terrae]|uniref:MBL fold metallo-hydrolase n=1 Tax=Terrirhizobium terrae TaxID=2926709 RepID=UPI0025762191|nr:MBL fold metallo-hydrolase [Rhizobium sp. CC-CFT758]WJH38739.1 MBL fold metallo-hydrolase [Rhizobium sp. CC-CFT758]